MTDTAYARLGVCGYPVDHSLSPCIHNALYGSLGYPWIYGLYPCPDQASFLELVQRVRLRDPSAPSLGFNVTTPYKSLASSCVDCLEGLAAQCSSVNTVLVEEDAGQVCLVGHNTDGSAARFLLERALGTLQDRTLVVCGTGSLAASILAALGGAGAHLLVLGRSQDSLGALAQRLSDTTFASQTYGQLDVSALEGAAALVNATTVGMRPGERLPLDPQPGMVVLDAVYASGDTFFLQQALERGCTVIDGLDLLVQQALEADLLWTDAARKAGLPLPGQPLDAEYLEEARQLMHACAATERPL